MKDKFDIISIVILMITVIILLFALASSEPIKQGEGIMRHNGFHSWNEYEHTKRLHKFHGTLSSYIDDDGSWCFERDGKKNSLWDPKTRTDM